MNSQTPFKLMLLCEVALGPMLEKKQAEFIEKLPPKYLSVKGMGTKGPDFNKNVVLSNGAKVPIGDIIDYDY
jgi:hypothetical protein